MVGVAILKIDLRFQICAIAKSKENTNNRKDHDAKCLFGALVGLSSATDSNLENFESRGGLRRRLIFFLGGGS